MRITRKQALLVSISMHLLLAAFLSRFEFEKITGLPSPTEYEIAFELEVHKEVAFDKSSNSEKFTNLEHSEEDDEILQPNSSPTNGQSRTETGNTSPQRDQVLLASLSMLDQMRSSFHFIRQRLPADAVGAFSPTPGIAPDTKATLEALNSGILKVAGFGRGNCPPKGGVPLLGIGPKKDFVTQMQEAIAAIERVDSYQDCLKIAKGFEKIAHKKPEKWLAAYWTAFAYCHAALLSWQNSSARNFHDHLATASQFAELAWQRLPVKTLGEESDLYALRANVYAIQARHFELMLDRASHKVFSKQAKKAFTKAKAARPDNPLVLVLQGTREIKHPATRPQALQRLRQLLSASEELRASNSMRPRLFRNWLLPWLGFHGLSPRDLHAI